MIGSQLPASVSGSSDREIKRRGPQACLQCRSIKARCHDVELGKCHRCRHLKVDCTFVPTRRGRNKGSKNLATLRKLAPRAFEDSAGTIAASPTSREAPHAKRDGRPQDRKAHPDDESDRVSFRFPLAYIVEQNRNGWDGREPHSVPTLPLPAEQLTEREAELWTKWNQNSLHDMFIAQERYWSTGLHGLKPDVGPALDAAQCGMVSEDQIIVLFDAFFRYANCQWGILDPYLHTPAHVRARSALLFTSILAIGAMALASLPHSDSNMIQLAESLQAHSDELLFHAFKTASRSVEIIQAGLLKIIWTVRTDRMVDDPRWIRLGLFTHIATAIGLQNRETYPDAAGLERALWMNNVKARIALLLLEARWASIRDGRSASSVELFDLTSEEWSIMQRMDKETPDAILLARYEVYRFERSSKTRLASMEDSCYALDCERDWTRTFLSAWRRRWSTPSAPAQDWHLNCHRLSEHLWILLRMGDVQDTRTEILEVAIELLQTCVSSPDMLCLIQHPVVFIVAGALIRHLTPSEDPARALILRVGLLLAGDPSRPEVMTFMKHVGLQMLSMACHTTTTPPHTKDASSADSLSSNTVPIDLSSSNGIVGSNTPVHIPQDQAFPFEDGGRSLLDMLRDSSTMGGFADNFAIDHTSSTQGGWPDWIAQWSSC